MVGTHWCQLLKQAEYQSTTAYLPALLVSQGNTMSWFTNLKIIGYLFSCSEILKSSVSVLKSKSSSHLHQSDFFLFV